MAYDRDLAARVREVVAVRAVARERAMFGGLGFLVDDTLAVCAGADGGLLVRVPGAEQLELLDGDVVAPMTMGTRTSRTWVRVAPTALTSYDELVGWVDRGLATVRGLTAG